MSVYLRDTCKHARHSGECKHYHFSFRLNGKRYRGSIPEARTKWQAEQAEFRIRREIFEGRFGKTEVGTRLGLARSLGYVRNQVREAGFDAFTIAALMGHSNVRTTQRYVRATERNKREAVQAAMLSSRDHNLATSVNAMTQNSAVA